MVGSTLVATEFEVEEFPELELRGMAQGLPPAGVALPVPLGSTLDFTLSLAAGIDLPVRLTGSTKVEDAPFRLFNGTPIEIEAIVRDFVIVLTEIELLD